MTGMMLESNAPSHCQRHYEFWWINPTTVLVGFNREQPFWRQRSAKMYHLNRGSRQVSKSMRLPYFTLCHFLYLALLCILQLYICHFISRCDFRIFTSHYLLGALYLTICPAKGIHANDFKIKVNIGKICRQVTLSSDHGINSSQRTKPQVMCNKSREKRGKSKFVLTGPLWKFIFLDL